MKFELSTSSTKRLSAFLALLVLMAVPAGLQARDSDLAGNDRQRYIVELLDPPLALYDGRSLSAAKKSGERRLTATSAEITGEGKLDVNSLESLEYLSFIAERHNALVSEAAMLLGRSVNAVSNYRVAVNGIALDLTDREAGLLRQSRLVRSVQADEIYRLETFAGPPWIGANDLWQGQAGFPANRGEGIIVGVLDSGVNWDHPSFSDPAPDGYNHSNPRGTFIGLCDDPEVMCNNKVIGVWDFVEDSPFTEDVVEENTKGRDNDGHGSHVASTAVGNPVLVPLGGGVEAEVSGVAPRANMIAYRVCFIGDPPGDDTDGCQGSAILSAIDQAISDGVDIINYSIGSGPSDPWNEGSIARAFLSARTAGIFIATSAGNSGPNEGTIGSPANAPWIMSVGSATHNQTIALNFEIIGGPDELACIEGNGPAISSTIGPETVVFAGDVGDPLGCSAFPAGSMNGSIALISRGDCFFSVKASNAAAAGADAMVVFNNVAGRPVNMEVSDTTIPSCMISKDQGVAARDFIQADPGARGRINYPEELVADDALGDSMAPSSSRGPVAPPAEDILKPNVIAPGVSIFAAWKDDQDFATRSGTSMSSPHVAGAAALLKAVHPDWNVSQISSALETTATTELAKDSDGGPVTPHDIGSGRPQLEVAVNAGLFLEAPSNDFLAANPSFGGDPGSLNLPTMVQDNCGGSCTFTRTVTDQVGGGSWTAVAEGFPADALVSVTPSNFTLGSGQSRALQIEIQFLNSNLVGSWVSGHIRLSSPGKPDQRLTASVFSDGGELPNGWVINDARNGGWKEFSLDGLVNLPDATYTSGGLTRPDRTSEVLPEDPTRDDVYDGGEGVYTKWYSLPQGALWLFAETLESTATDLDLFVGRDDNGNQRADESEEICSSTTPADLEECSLLELEPGDYWILVQNWDGTAVDGDEATLRSAAITASDNSSLHATGPGRIDSAAEFNVRVSWDNLNAAPGEQFLGAVGIQTDRNNPLNIGVIPLRFNRTAVSAPETFPLMNGFMHGMALDGGGVHDRLFIDIPPGVESLTVTANGANAGQSENLRVDLVRLDFSEGLSNPPFATPAAGGAVVVTASGSDGEGPEAVIQGSVQSGRWYAVLTNEGEEPASISVKAEAAFSEGPMPFVRGIWEPNSRSQINQGYEYHDGSSSSFLVWYTYEESGQPTWFYSQAANPDGNIWTVDVLRLTNDGADQQVSRVGMLSVTTLAENDQLFSFTLYGESGTDRLQPLGIPECSEVGGVPQSYSGHWYRGAPGLGGASIHVNEVTQGQIHYLYDDDGNPRWLVAQDPENLDPYDPVLPFLQFTGFCAICESAPRFYEIAGTLERHFDTESNGEWTMDYELVAPLSGSAQRTDQISKLTDTIGCP